MLIGECLRMRTRSMPPLIQLITHTIWVNTNTMLHKPPATPRSMDANGAVTVLQMAVSQGRQIHLFLTSGTGLIADQAAGYTFQMQQALNLCSAECYGRGKQGLFKRVTFTQPLIPYVERPSKHLSARTSC
jgi:hypothetical protein